MVLDLQAASGQGLEVQGVARQVCDPGRAAHQVQEVVVPPLFERQGLVRFVGVSYRLVEVEAQRRLDPDRCLRAILVEDAAVQQVRGPELRLAEGRGVDLAVGDELVDRLLVEHVAGREEDGVERHQGAHVDRLAEPDDGAGER